MKGFTLIELLVVVLIIGILAAVALPQYKKAVVKARFAEAMTNLKTLHQASKVCHLGKGELCSLDELSISVGTAPATLSSCPFWQDEKCDTTETQHFFYMGSDYSSGVANGSNRFVVAAQYKDEDVCLCLEDDKFSIHNSSCVSTPPSLNYSKLLNLPNDSSLCQCC